jgi:hypothetical protein
MSTSKTQCLAPFFKIYKGMKVIVIEKLYSKLGIINRNIGYVENIFLTNFEWILKDIAMHLPINVLVNLNDFIGKNIKLQNIKLESLLKSSYQQYPYQGISNITITYKNQTPIKHLCNQ